MASTPEPLAARWLGRMRFAEALELQLGTREDVIAGRAPETLLLVEHPPVLTLGRRARPSDVLWSTERLAAAGIEVCEAPRGGEVTLHAPGQLVAYPIVRVGQGVRRHVARLGAVDVALLGELGVAGAEYRADSVGVWVGDRKVGSIGIHVSRGVAVQGTSLNLEVDATLFGALVSCGLHGVEPTSAVALGGRVPAIEVAARAWAELWARATETTLAWA